MYNKELDELFSSYTNLYISFMKVSSTFMSIYLDSIRSDRDGWLDRLSSMYDEELSSEGFIAILDDYINSWLKIHRILRESYPFSIKVMDLLTELYVFNSANLYISLISNILGTYRELDSTPYEVIYKKGPVRLLHYKSNNSHPLLIVYSIINRYNIMDISKDKSVIRRLLDGGIDLYLIEWGDVSYSDQLSLRDYIYDIHDAVEYIKKVSGKERISMLGYCWGGIFTVIYASLYNDVSNLIIMAAPIDASKDDTTLARWSKGIDLSRFIEEYEYMHGQILNILFVLRNPARYILKYITLLNRLDDPVFVDTFMAVERWLYNTPIIPRSIYGEIIKIYKENTLVSNSLIIDRRVDLSRIDIPLLIIVADNDDIVSPASTKALFEYVSSKDKSVINIPGGHVGLCISSVAHKRIWPNVAEWIIKYSNI